MSSEPKISIIYFWRPYEKNGWMCNWSLHAVRENGITFKTVEHFYMYHKAVMMGDARSAEMVLLAKTPREAKGIGRSVANWDETKWVAVREEIMLRGLGLKIKQHPLLKLALVQTAGKFLAEASPFDAVWGIGCDAANPRARDPAQWPGRNLLGKLWMRLRETVLLAEEEIF